MRCCVWIAGGDVMKLIHLWVIMSMLIAGYSLISDHELTKNEVAMRIIVPFFAWPVIVGAELHKIKNELIGDRK